MSISLAFRDSLASVSQIIVDELDQLVAGIKGFLLTEHNEDGSHSDITADSLIIASENPFFGFYRLYGDASNVVTRKLLEMTAEQVPTNLLLDVLVFTLIDALYLAFRTSFGELLIGGGATDNPTLATGPSIRWSKIGTTAASPAWALGIAQSAHSALGQLPFAIFDATNAATVLNLWRNYGGEGTNTYKAGPDTSVGSATAVSLGDRSQASRMFSSIAALLLYARDGVQERSRTTAMGEWIDVAYASGNFTGNGSMTWTVGSGDQLTFAYTLVGKTMTVSFILATTSVGGTPNTTLQIAIPGGFVSAKQMRNAVQVADNSNLSRGVAIVDAAGTVIRIQTFPVTGSVVNTWSAATNTTSVQGQITFEVQ